MKRLIPTLGLILAIVLIVGRPVTLAQKEPVLSLSKGTPEPTPPPPPASEQKEESPPTLIPTEKPTAMPTPTPTFPPLPTSEPQTSDPTNTATSTATPPPTVTSAPAETPTTTLSPSPPSLISGMVFDDRDGDGVRDPDEPGIGGVPVALDGEVVGTTDSGGRFSLPLSGPCRALLAIVPPAGWQWAGEPLITDEVIDNVAIPLHRLEPAEASTATTMVAASVALVLLLLVFNGATSLLQAVAVRSWTRTYRQQKAQEMEYRQDQAIARRKAEIEQLLADDAGNWRQVVAQILADAVPGADTAWLTTADVSTTPVPRFDVVGQDNQRYTFTVSPATLRRKSRVIPLDASLSPAMRMEVQIAWEHLAEQHGLDLQLLPRRAEWFLVLHRRKKRLVRRGDK